MKSKLILAMTAVALTAFFGVSTAEDMTPSHNHMSERGGAVHAKKTNSASAPQAAIEGSEKSKAVTKNADKHNHGAERGGYVGSASSDAAK